MRATCLHHPLCMCVAFAWLALVQTAVGQRGLQEIPDPDPAKQLASFIVADGFDVNLYASDPQIAKPIQMNFDAQGRLWIASSEVYPQIKPGQQANDKIIVVADTNGDGTADTHQVFADGLLIPTGVLPATDGVYVVNSTELLHLSDTDGDFKADRRRVLLSGFGTEDTHHLLHTLRWGHDGCIYMNQSIYIHSHIETPYGVKRLNGGGIWRFKPDTMQLDVFCKGFVNTWGHHFDKWGQSFVTDGAGFEGIHYVFPGSVFISSPGAKRTLRGLNPGSPKHCGLEILSGRHLPDEWQGNIITNDFRAHRVCRFVLSEDGAGFAARQESELIKTRHVAFRPVDVKMGPDGAIYVADWYNPIIQHGEVDFRDDRRDHSHGRIWRITAKDRPSTKLPDFAAASIDELLELLEVPEQWVRLQAKLELKNRDSAEVVAAAARWLAALAGPPTEIDQRSLEALWLHQTIRKPNAALLAQLTVSADPRLRAAAIRVHADWVAEVKQPLAALRTAAQDNHPRVRLEAVRALAGIPSAAAADAAALVLGQPMDRFLDFATWQAMRDLQPYWRDRLLEGKQVFGGDIDALVFAIRATEETTAVAPLIRLLQQGQVASEKRADVLSVVATLGNARDFGLLLGLLTESNGRLSDAQRAVVLHQLVDASRSRQLTPSASLDSIRGLLDAPNPDLRAAAIRAVGAWKIEETRGRISRFAMMNSSRADDAKSRLAAIEALTHMGGRASINALETVATNSTDMQSRRQAIIGLTQIDNERAARVLTRLLEMLSPEHDMSEPALAVLNRQGGPGLFAKALRGRQYKADVAKRLIRDVQRSGRQNSELINAIRRAGTLQDAGWELTPSLMQELVAEVTASGDPHRGEAIYRRGDLQCMKCHAIGGAGGRVGPELISVGASAPVDYIIESLIQPNKKLKENYHTIVIQTVDGKVLTGVPVRESTTELVLRDGEDREQLIPVSAIQQRREGRSLMADGAVDGLTRRELVDLVRFLSELGKVGQFSIGKERVARRWQTLVASPAANNRIRRTSFDIVASDDPVFVWKSVYSTVAGELPINRLDQIAPRSEFDPSSFVRSDINVTEAGNIALKFNDVTGLLLWIDGKPVPLIEPVKEMAVGRGRYQLTLAVNHKQRGMPLRLELVAGEAQFVNGK